MTHTVFACGLNHKTAPVGVREGLTFVPDELGDALLHLQQQAPVREAALLSTCNRTELYCYAENAEFFVDWLAHKRQLKQAHIAPYLYFHESHHAMRHISRVACGLDSMVLGEPEIFGQMKHAFATAQSQGTLGTQLGDLFRHICAISKRVRTETAIGAESVSVASTALNLAKRIYSDLSQKSILLVGAGQTIQSLAKHLKSHGADQLTVINRTHAHAITLAEELDAKAQPIEELAPALTQADMIVTACASPISFIDQPMVAQCFKSRKHRPMLLIDLAVPRNITPEVGHLEDVFLYNIDDLQAIVSEGLSKRREAAITAENMIEQEVHAFTRQRQSLRAVDTIRDYRSAVETITQAELSAAMAALDNQTDPKAVLEAFAHRLTHKIMHHPVTQLRQAAENSRFDLIHFARKMLGL